MKNKCHPNIKFTMESETNNTLPYLDILAAFDLDTSLDPCTNKTTGFEL